MGGSAGDIAGLVFTAFLFLIYLVIAAAGFLEGVAAGITY
jgi:hypothetical protein